MRLSLPWKRPRGLRALFTTVSAALSILGLIAAAALIIATTSARRAADILRESVESVRLGSEAEVDLVLHTQTEDALSRAREEADLRGRLAEAQRYVSSEVENEALKAAWQSVDTYLVRSRSRGSDVSAYADDAFRKLAHFLALNLEQARNAQLEAARIDAVGETIGGAIIGLILATVPFLILWFHASLRRVVAIAETLKAYGEGNESLRLPERGPLELREIAARFNEMAEELKRRKESSYTFVAAIAHELRTPLSTLSLSTARVAPERPLPGEGDLRKLLGTVRHQVLRLDSMVSDLLEFARIEGRRLSVDCFPHDLRDIAQTAVDLVRLAVPGAQLELSVPAQEVVTSCDAARVEQVLLNLLNNAIKYTPRSEIIRMQVGERAGEAFVSITDKGGGISKEEQRNIFEPFFRTDDARRTAPGTGLGLYISQQIMKAHGGRLEFESEQNTGSTFRMCFPASLDALPESQRSDLFPKALVPTHG